MGFNYEINILRTKNLSFHLERAQPLHQNLYLFNLFCLRARAELSMNELAG